MAGGFNRVELIGNLGDEPKCTPTQTGSVVANFSLAVTETRRDQNSGEYIQETEWVRVVAFGRTAEIVRDYLHKGSQVHIEGKLRTRSYEDKNSGEKKYSTEVVCSPSGLLMLGSRADSMQQGGNSNYQSYGNKSNSNYGNGSSSNSSYGNGGYQSKPRYNSANQGNGNTAAKAPYSANANAQTNFNQAPAATNSFSNVNSAQNGFTQQAPSPFNGHQNSFPNQGFQSQNQGMTAPNQGMQTANPDNSMDDDIPF